MGREKIANPQVVFVHADGRRVPFPTIVKSGNGYYMKPDEARTQWEIDHKQNRSWGTLAEGFKGMYDWLHEYIYHQFESAVTIEHNINWDDDQWAWFINSHNPIVMWKDRLLGPVSAQLTTSRFGTQLTLTTAPNWAEVLIKKDMGQFVHDDNANDYWDDFESSLWPGRRTTRTEFRCPDSDPFWGRENPDGTTPAQTAMFDDLPKFIAKATELIPDHLKWWFRDLDPNKIELVLGAYYMPRDGATPHENCIFASGEDYAFHSNNIAEALPADTLAALEKMALVLRKFGEVSIHQSNGVPLSMSISVRGVRNSENEIIRHNHGVSLDLQTGAVRVTCGYEDDDKKYVEWQRREAAALMRQLDDDFEDLPEQEDEYQEIDIFNL